MFPITIENLSTLELTFCWLVMSFMFLLALAVYSYFSNDKGE